MASRDWITHTTGSNEPTGARLGDEWYNTGTNRLLKSVAVDGNNVIWREVAGGIVVQQNGTSISSSANLLNFANASVTLDGTTGGVRITTTSSPAGSNTQVQFNNAGNLAGSSAFTFNVSTNLLTAAGDVNFIGNTSAPKILTLSPNTSGSDLSSQNILVRLGLPAAGNPPSTSGVEFSNWSGAGSGLARIYYNNGGANSGLEINAGNSITRFINQTGGTHAIVSTAGVWTYTNAPIISALTSGRVTFATTSGQLTDSSNLTWNGTTLGVTGFTSTNRVTIVNGVQGAWSGAAGIAFQTSGTNTATDGAGTIASRVNYSFNATTMASTNANTVTNAINLFVDAPVAGTNTTFTTPWALYAQGNTRVTGILFCDTTIQQNAGFQFLSASTAVSTAGSVQGDATLITNTVNNVTTVGASTQGIRLPVLTTPGARVIVRNGTSTAFNVYPGSGAQINTLGTNSAFVMPATLSATIEFIAITTTQWNTLASTYA